MRSFSCFPHPRRAAGRLLEYQPEAAARDTVSLAAASGWQISVCLAPPGTEHLTHHREGRFYSFAILLAVLGTSVRDFRGGFTG